MKLFAPIYRRTMQWSRRPRAEDYLAAVSFAESWFFPVPTAAMLAPMTLANRARAFRLATVATAASVAGGVFGYAVGYFLFEQLGRPIIFDWYNGGRKFAEVQNYFAQHGGWLILLAGASPIPYKIFTIAAGFVKFSLAWFILASIVGRAMQFFLVAAIVKLGGETMQNVIEKRIELIGWGVVGVVLLGWFILR